MLFLPMISQHGHSSAAPASKEQGILPAALKLRDACQYLGGVSPITVRRLIARGLIKANRSLRHILIPVAELDRFIDSGGSR
jgi:excisionase family DNA binding protein